MKKMEKITPINPITIGIGGLHPKKVGHKYDIGVVTKAIRGGYIKDMLIRRFHDSLLKSYHF